LLARYEDAQAEIGRLKRELANAQALVDEEAQERHRLEAQIQTMEQAAPKAGTYMRNFTATSMIERMRGMQLLDWVDNSEVGKAPSIISQPTSPVFSERSISSGSDAGHESHSLELLRQTLETVQQEHREQIKDMETEIESLKENLALSIQPTEKPMRTASFSLQLKQIISERDAAIFEADELRHRCQLLEHELALAELAVAETRLAQDDSPSTAVMSSPGTNLSHDVQASKLIKVMEMIKDCDPRNLQRRAAHLQPTDAHWEALRTLPKHFDIQELTILSNNLMQTILDDWKLGHPISEVTELVQSLVESRQARNEAVLLWSVCLEKLAQIDVEKRKQHPPLLVKRPSLGARFFSFLSRKPSNVRAESSVELSE